MALPDSRTVSFIVFFPTRKECSKDANDSPLARHLKQYFSRCPEMLVKVAKHKKQLPGGKKKSKEKKY